MGVLDPIIIGEKVVEERLLSGRSVQHVTTPSLDNINKFWGLSVARKLMDLKVFPNVKEITEAMSMWRVLGKEGFFGLNRQDRDVLVVCVGDGSTPRLAALAALSTNWDVLSVDPNLNPSWATRNGVERLQCIAKPIEEVSLSEVELCDLKSYKAMIILACHAHVEPKAMLESLVYPCPRHLVCMPCCVEQEVYAESGYDGFLERVWPSSQYEDWGNWSPKRLVKVWKNV